MSSCCSCSLYQPGQAHELRPSLPRWHLEGHCNVYLFDPLNHLFICFNLWPTLYDWAILLKILFFSLYKSFMSALQKMYKDKYKEDQILCNINKKINISSVFIQDKLFLENCMKMHYFLFLFCWIFHEHFSQDIKYFFVEIIFNGLIIFYRCMHYSPTLKLSEFFQSSSLIHLSLPPSLLSFLSSIL